MPEKRLKERFEDFQRALARLEESIQLEVTNNIVIDGVIQRFEFTFEQSWKVIKVFLENEGIVEEVKSPRSAIRAAFKYGLIPDGEAWISMMLDKNKTSHLYDESIAEEIYKTIKENYVNLFNDLNKELKKLKN